MPMQSNLIDASGGSQPHTNIDALSMRQLHHFIIWYIPFTYLIPESMADPFVAGNSYCSI